MSEKTPSIVTNFSKEKRRHCGYCNSKDGFFTYGLYAHTLTVEDYQNMIDRGWRRCGHYCYKSIMNSSCCPLYTIKCAAVDFRPSKSQKKILKKFNNFLVNGTIKNMKESLLKKTEIGQVMDSYHLEENRKNYDKIAENSFLPLNSDFVIKGSTQCEEIKIDSITNTSSSFSKEKMNKSKPLKAKFLRIERKKKKLKNLGFNEEDINKKMLEKKKHPVIKSIEDFLNDSLSQSAMHNLKVTLVRSFPPSEEFNRTFADSFNLYKRYQMSIHNDLPEKLTQNQFKRFLVISPLQIQLVPVRSPEFENSLKESALLFSKYQSQVHHESYEENDFDSFNNFLVESPLKASSDYGSYHQQYWLDNKLIAVGVIDILPRCVSSVYFYYDPDYRFLSLGTYGALREVEFTRKLSRRFPDLIYYYMGFYVHSCTKMKYKAAFKPSFLLCPEVYTWHGIQDCLPKLNLTKYSRLNDDPHATDFESDISISEVLILYKRRVMPLEYYLKERKCDLEEKEEIIDYAKLVGKTSARNMLLFRN